jgi:hypothetical protein
VGDVSQRDVDSWISAIVELYTLNVTDGRASFEAHEAMANLWSGFGWSGAPPEVLDMLIRATETGYAVAVQHLMDGELDHLIDDR